MTLRASDEPVPRVDLTSWGRRVSLGPPATGVHEGLVATLLNPAGPGAAVSDDTGVWSHRELADQAQRAGALLQEAGVSPGDRVLVLATARRELVALLFGAMLVGAVVVPVHPRAPTARAAAVVLDAAPALVVGPANAPSLRAAVSAAGGVAPIIMGWDEFIATLAATPPRFHPVTLKSSDSAILFYTSGSTAAPRAVVASHRQVVFCTTAICARLGYRADDVVLVRLPLSFDYAFYQIMLCAAVGAHLVLCPPDDLGVALWRHVRRSGATVLPVVPQLARTLLLLTERDTRPSQLRLITNTGEHLDEVLQAELRSRFPGLKLALMYGLTECKRATIEVLEPDDPTTATVGRPLPGCGVAVCDQTGRALPLGQIGEILVFGQNVADGYRGSTTEGAAVFTRCATTGTAVLLTGDRGRLDPTGRLQVLGRSDGVFKSAGVRTSTAEIEAVANRLLGVHGAVAVPDSRTGRSVLWVCGGVNAEEVLIALADQFEQAKVPARCEVVDVFPTTPNGKVDRVALTERSLL